MEKIKEILQDQVGDAFFILDVKEDVHANMVKVIVDGVEPISLGTTSKLSKIIRQSNTLDEYYPKGYRLEVSSPGIGSQLSFPFQYKKNIGRKFSVSYQDGEQVKSLDGVLHDANDSQIVLSNKKGEIALAYDSIISAMVVVSFQ